MKTKKVLFILLLMVVALTTVNLAAQEAYPLPVDEAVRIGKLDNGLTYYIRHNDYPEHRMNFYIAQRVGSMQEENHQRGLAHFLEHMAFNGSEHFKGNGIVDYTRSLGVEFGSDLNAETGFVSTIYHVNNVPSNRENALDSCLLILKDWSHGLLLEDDDIDNERGVIHQEWRMRNTGTLRMLENMMTKGFPGSKFAERMPIGLMEIVDNFPYRSLRDYYHTWYRPDNQALVIVGDIDVDLVEAKIREMFKDIPAAPDNAPQVDRYPVPDNEEGIYITFKDKELQQNSVSILFKHEPVEREIKGTMTYPVITYLKNMMCSMLNTRFSEMSQQADCPFSSVNCADGPYLVANTKDAFGMDIVPKDGMAEAALQVVLTELKRVKQYGFTASEYDRARQNYMSRLESYYNQRDKLSNNYYGTVCCDNFLEGEPIVDAETNYQMMNMIVPQFTADVINQSIQQMLNNFIVDSGRNMVVVNNEVDKDGAVHPTVDGLKSAVAAARVATVEPYVDNVIEEPLLATLPKPGKIVKETENSTFGYKELELSNGVHVILKKTDFNPDEIRMTATQRGGKSLYGEQDFYNLFWLDLKINTITGLGNLGYNDLMKVLTGKRAWVEFSMSDYADYVSGSSNVKDLETMFQLTYLKFTAMSKDENSYNRQREHTDQVFLKHRDSDPENVFDDTTNYILANRSWRGRPFASEDLKLVDYDRIMEIVRERTANAANYTFVFVGAFDEATIRPLIEQYIASLPANKGKKSNWVNYYDMPTGENVQHFTSKMEVPQGQEMIYWLSDKIPYTLENQLKAYILGQLLEQIYLKKIREDAGAAYTAGAAGWMQLEGNKPITMFMAGCPVKPEFKDEALKIINDEMRKACTTIDPVALKGICENILKNHGSMLKENLYWLRIIDNYQTYGIDNYSGYEEIIKAQTPETIAEFARQLYNAGNRVEVVMTPEE